MELRKATFSDLPRLVELVISSMPGDHTYGYQWPHHGEYPKEMSSLWEFKLEELLPESRVIVEEGNVIALGIWAQESLFPTKQRDAWPPERLNREFERVGSRARDDALGRASASVRDHINKLGFREFSTINLLVTDCSFRRKGAAGMLVDEFVKEAGERLCLVEASRMGEPLYVKKGFEKVMDMPVKVDGEQEETSFAFMLRWPRGHGCAGQAPV